MRRSYSADTTLGPRCCDADAYALATPMLGSDSYRFVDRLNSKSPVCQPMISFLPSHANLFRQLILPRLYPNQ